MPALGHRSARGLDKLDHRKPPEASEGSPRWWPYGRGVPFTQSDHESRSSPRRLGWWVRDRDGRLTIAQAPNPALGVWLAARLLEWTGMTSLDEATLRGIGTGALLVWSIDEVLRGASPFRRVLGAVVLAGQLTALLS